MSTDNPRPINERRLELDIKRYELDAEDSIEERKVTLERLRQERTAKRWTQVSVMVPVLAIVLTYWANQLSESSKYAQQQHAESVKEQRAFIRKQLSELYYPLALHLKKDDAIWELWNQNQFSDKNKAIAVEVEKSVLLPNHDQIIHIIDTNFYLVKSDWENTDLTSIYELFNHYQRHIAAYKALRATGDRRNPMDLGPDYAFPLHFSEAIAARIKQLEEQYAHTQ